MYFIFVFCILSGSPEQEFLTGPVTGTREIIRHYNRVFTVLYNNGKCGIIRSRKVIPLNILLALLNEQLCSLLHTKAEVTETKKETLLTYANPYGGKPLQVLYRPAEDFKVTLNKTPRYYQPDSTKRLLADVASYAEGKTVSLDVTDHSGVESKSDRITSVADLEKLDLDALIALVIRINLLDSAELKDLLASGGTVNVHFWNAKKDFRFRQIGDRLEKI